MASKQTQELAIKAIKLVQEAILRDFGLKVEMGAELEFCAYPLQGENPNPLKLPEEMIASLELGARLFPKSPYITKDYKEAGINKYELVFHHERTRSPVVLARAVEAARSLVQNKAGLRDVSVSFSAVAPKHDFGENNHPVPVTCSLQTNISFKDEQGQPLLQDEVLGQALAHAALPMQHETMLLCLPSPDSCKRFAFDAANSPKAIAARTSVHQYDASIALRSARLEHTECDYEAQEYGTHIENRLAGSDADPYCVVLASLAQMYDGLLHLSHGCEAGPRKFVEVGEMAKRAVAAHNYSLPAHREVVEQFAKGHALSDMLNGLSAGLGDRLKQSVLQDLVVALPGAAVPPRQ